MPSATADGQPSSERRDYCPLSKLCCVPYTTAMEIRAARPDEGTLLSQLAFESKAYWGYSPQFMAQCRDELRVSDELLASGLVWVATLAEQVLGFYSLEWMESDASPTLDLKHLFVAPERLRQGVGSALFEHAALRAATLGAKLLVIQSDPSAEAFYIKGGARRVGELESDSIPGRQLPLLELSLGEKAAPARP